ncbi:MAG TPA: transcription elongation factor GreA, partial [Rhodobiaceae bacterium]|nr:transcription elongation factor GreA [Rhodobiaceae bacterium]
MEKVPMTSGSHEVLEAELKKRKNTDRLSIIAAIA